MRFILLLCAMTLSVPAYAQENVELLIFGAMVEGPEGTPLASATGIGGSPEAAVYLTSEAILSAENACLRIWAEGPCHPTSADSRAATGLDGMAWMTVGVQQQDTTAKFNANPITKQPLVGDFDPATDTAQATFLTQNPFGGWETPVAASMISGGAGNRLTLRNPALSPLSLGAPVVTAEKGLVGVVVRAVDGVGQVAGLTEVTGAALANGVKVPDMMRPRGTAADALPPRVESEMGRVIVFADQGLLNWIGGFYGPSGGAGFDAAFVTTIDFSVWQVPRSGAGKRIAGYDKRLPLVPVGMQFEAPFRGRSPDHLASCVVHAAPSSEGRPAMVVQFWRFNAVMGTSQTGFRSFDEAAPPLTAWADGDDPCAAAIGDLDEARRAALFGVAALEAVTPAKTSAPPETGIASAGDWESVSNWEATEIEAIRITLGGRALFVGCTQSGELAVALRPGTGATDFVIGGQPASDGGTNGDAVYALFPATARDRLLSGASIGWREGDKALNVPAPSAPLLTGDC